MQETLAFHEVDSDRWGDLERLFESSGGPKYCWCMVWRSMPDVTGRSDRGAKKAALEQRIREDVPVGILGYVDGDPVAWCSIAPRETYRAGLHHSRSVLRHSKSVDEPGSVWSLACFFVPRRLRRRGVAKRLLYAAIDHARSKGAAVLEAYPVDPDSPSYRFMGFVPLFEAAGFREVGTAGLRRHVMRLPLAEG